jgi:hypothetical protein
MWKRMPRVPKNFLPVACLTGCFTLIAVGCGIIGGLGVGLMIGGVLGVVAVTVAAS